MSDNGDGDSWAFSESRDWLDGRHEREPNSPPHPGEVRDRATRETLTAAYQAFERMARKGRIRSSIQHITENSSFNDIREFHAAESVAHAVETGDASRMRHLVGSREPSADLSGLRTIKTLEEIVNRQPMLIYMIGVMGAGKTMFAGLLGELWEIENPNGNIASNVRTLDSAEWLNEWGAVEEWAEEPEETVLAGEITPKLYILDEGSSVAAGHGEQGYLAQMRLGRFVLKMRKYGVDVIIIGHDGKDVIPSIRELAIICKKTGKKNAQFWQDVNNRKVRDPVTPELTGIPLPDRAWQANTYDLANFFWDDQDGNELSKDAIKEAHLFTVIKGKEQGLTDRELAEFVPYSREWVRTRWKEYDEEGLHKNTVGNIEAVIT